MDEDIHTQMDRRTHADIHVRTWTEGHRVWIHLHIHLDTDVETHSHLGTDTYSVTDMGKQTYTLTAAK